MNKLLFTIIFILYSSVSALANPSVQARTGILMDFHSDAILFELEPDQQIYPASMTKIMTAIVAFDLTVFRAFDPIFFARKGSVNNFMIVLAKSAVSSKSIMNPLWPSLIKSRVEPAFFEAIIGASQAIASFNTRPQISKSVWNKKQSDL